MKYVFFGTPRFASIVLEKLIDGGNPPSVLICNPDKPVGRKKIITPPPTKQLVLDRGLDIEILQPSNKAELAELSKKFFSENDFGVVAAYAKIIPKEVIDKARLGIIGVHPSLLPKHRGATPIQTAILGGDEETGVTLFLLDEKVDNGPILARDKIRVTARQTGFSDTDYEVLEKRLADLGAELLAETLPKFILGKVEKEEQDESEATYTKKITTEDAYIDPEDLRRAEESGDNALEIWRKIRAFNPEPGAYSYLDGKRTKLLEAEMHEGKLALKKIQKEGGKPLLVSSK